MTKEEKMAKRMVKVFAAAEKTVDDFTKKMEKIIVGRAKKVVVAALRTIPAKPKLSLSGAQVEHVEITYLNSNSVVFDNNWHHIVWTDNRGNAKLYVDGNLDGTNFNYTPPVISLNRTLLGVQPYQNGIIDTTFFNGSIDDLMAFKRELSAVEVQGLYANTSSKYLSTNFTNLTSGNYSIKAYVEDTVGNVNMTEQRNVTITSTP